MPQNNHKTNFTYQQTPTQPDSDTSFNSNHFANLKPKLLAYEKTNIQKLTQTYLYRIDKNPPGKSAGAGSGLHQESEFKDSVMDFRSLISRQTTESFLAWNKNFENNISQIYSYDRREIASNTTRIQATTAKYEL